MSASTRARWRPVLLAGAFFVFSVGSAVARDGHDQYKMIGAGAFKCTRALEAARDPAVKRVLETWIAGYLTAANFAESDTYAITGTLPPEQFVNELLSVCRDDPEQLIGAAMASWLQRIFPNRLKSAP